MQPARLLTALLAAAGIALAPTALAADVKTEEAKKKPDAAAQKKAGDGSVKPATAAKAKAGDGSVKPSDAAKAKAGDGSVKPADTKAHKPFAPADAKADAAKATK